MIISVSDCPLVCAGLGGPAEHDVGAWPVHESTTHAVIPWRGAEPRRTLLYRFCPGFMSFHGQHSEVQLPEWASELTAGQLARLEPPYRASTKGGGLRQRQVDALRKAEARL